MELETPFLRRENIHAVGKASVVPWFRTVGQRLTLRKIEYANADSTHYHATE
jgi:hypothetical protein